MNPHRHSISSIWASTQLYGALQYLVPMSMAIIPAVFIWWATHRGSVAFVYLLYMPTYYVLGRSLEKGGRIFICIAFGLLGVLEIGRQIALSGDGIFFAVPLVVGLVTGAWMGRLADFQADAERRSRDEQDRIDAEESAAQILPPREPIANSKRMWRVRRHVSRSYRREGVANGK